jgi:PP-loop superfamily ATP-utilizing enzyme
METHRLINFRAPIAIQTMFDEVCDYQCQSRTAVLVSLMSGYISQRSEEIQKQIASVTALKNDLIKMGNSRNQSNTQKNKSNRFYDDENEFEDNSDPVGFYINQGI